MTSTDLYLIYVQAYAESSHFEGERMPAAPAGLSLRLRRMLSVERTIVELARNDATNGTPRRTRGAFERTLHAGRRALAGLDLAASGT